MLTYDETRYRRERELVGELYALSRARPEQADPLFDWTRVLNASGSQDWSLAQVERTEMERIARLWGIKPRFTNNSFYARTLTSASSGASLVSVSAQQQVGVPPPSNDFLHLCDVRRPDGRFGDTTIGRWDSLPTASVQATETTQISESSPTSSVTTAAPVNVGVVLTASKQWALQSPGGAEAAINLAVNSVRTKVQQQVIEGSGASGELVGFLNDAAVPNAAGTTLAMSHVAAALESVESGGGDGPLAWVVTSGAAEILRQRAEVSGGPAILRDGRIGGYPVIVVGGCSGNHAVFGRWQDYLVIERQPIEISVNPFQIFAADIIGLKAWTRFDAAPRVNGSFYLVKSIT